MLEQIVQVAAALLVVLVLALWTMGLPYKRKDADDLPLWPPDRDLKGAEEAMEKYAKRQRERPKAYKDKAANGAPGPDETRPLPK
jgi:hypothetical protein